jgi:hypothetical protein
MTTESVSTRNAPENLLALQEDLQQKRYQPGAYVTFTIHEPKRRLISAAPFADRVVHHALCNIKLDRHLPYSHGSLMT